MMDIHHPHIGPAPEGPLLNGVGRLGERPPEADRAGRGPARTLNKIARRTKLVEGKTRPAAGLLDQGRLLDRLEDVLDAVRGPAARSTR